MFLGTYTLGQYVPIAALIRNGEVAAVPVAAPRATVYNGVTKMETFTMPAIDSGAIDGLFVANVLLDFGYSVGQYSVAINYMVGSSKYLVTHHFRIVGGGDLNGAIISQAFYRRPQASFLVQKLDTAYRRIVKNPRAT